jgi:Ino eighty subunit 1
MFHYLEGPDKPNPYDDDYSRDNPGKVPWLHRINDADMQRENVDTPEEIQWGNMMSTQRDTFLQRLMSSIDAEKKAKPTATVNPTKEVNYHRLRQRHMPNGEREKPFLHYVPPTREQQSQAGSDRRRVYAPRPRARRSHSGPTAAYGEQRTLLQHAWQVVSVTDPLIDSDEELAEDAEHVRRDYIQRLNVINRLRGRSPTPPPEPEEPPPPDTRKRKPKGFWRRVES